MSGGVRAPSSALWTFLPRRHAACAVRCGARLRRAGMAPRRGAPAASGGDDIHHGNRVRPALPERRTGRRAARNRDGFPGLRPSPIARDAGRGRRPVGVAMSAVMVFPLARFGVSLVSLVLTTPTREPRGLTVVDRTQLRGLAVPTEEPGLLDAFSRGPPDPGLLSRARKASGTFEYLGIRICRDTLEAADLLRRRQAISAGRRHRSRSGQSAALHAGGRAAARRQSLVGSGRSASAGGETLFAEAATCPRPEILDRLCLDQPGDAEYGAYLAEHFPIREETPTRFCSVGWTMHRPISAEAGYPPYASEAVNRAALRRMNHMPKRVSRPLRRPCGSMPIAFRIMPMPRSICGGR